MTRIVRTEHRKRGFFGFVFKWVFVLFNIFMLICLIAGIANVGGTPPMNEAEKAGQAVGLVIGVGLIMSIWGAGALILGLFVMLTRGKKVVIEEHVT
jgi:hypothetical protein